MIMENENSLSRRTLLCGLAVLTLGFVPDKAIAATGVKVLPNGKVEIRLSSNRALRKVGGVVQFKDGSGRSLALVRTTNAVNGFRAINLSCTHEGEKVILSGDKWVCPEHRAEFAVDGKVQVGPAKTDLRSVPVRATKTRVTVG
jgi:Rieske Fe-S protein